MKSIEERAEEYQGKLASSFLGFPDLLVGGYNGYIQGATEQKAIDIEKACEWITNWIFENAPHQVYDDFMSDIPELKKALEE